ncbi:hypothetical protein SAMN05444483_10982 [Salegentibacter echinorum]|uniref:Uncharacterized protein n=1 Tax=Salegentibacter echinorum TaxID=1073325 RepID=A0A1M5J1W6_SALEC|nr:hypothetical protein [Salegentibacter echinorum]SHG34587.1 hypothetical protein SAMN05444483_10982 [Salegentibacter echinorum]
MKANQFKSSISEVKDLLRGKILTLEFMNEKGRVRKIQFSSLKAFGNAVLKLEQMGAGFNIVKVGNDFTEKGIYKPSELSAILKRGSWNEVFFYATTVKA